MLKCCRYEYWTPYRSAEVGEAVASGLVLELMQVDLPVGQILVLLQAQDAAAISQKFRQLVDFIARPGLGAAQHVGPDFVEVQPPLRMVFERVQLVPAHLPAPSRNCCVHFEGCVPLYGCERREWRAAHVCMVRLYSSTTSCCVICARSAIDSRLEHPTGN